MKKHNLVETFSVDREFLITHISKEIYNIISRDHIRPVVNLIFEELISELAKGTIITVGNLGKIFILKLSDRKHHNYLENKTTLSKGKKIARFELQKEISQLLNNFLDVAKTFASGQDNQEVEK